MSATSAGWAVTYEIITPESAADGDAAERGFYSRGDWRHEDRSAWTLREVVNQFRGCCEDSGCWFSTVDPDHGDYTTDGETFYGVHPPGGITRASYNRVRRLLCGK